ncbi:MAG TPA: hypothetical protein VNW92_23925 [Polyangiaceae bacterium]|jgi:hypothetical protein|nr:hypothetical protein [Polyangiaceae bacterium]
MMIASAAAVGALRWRLDAAFSATKVRNDVYALPPPAQLVKLSLGYRSALADLIFAHVLVSSGLHYQDKRAFEFVGAYLNSVNALDPKFVTPYRFADTLLTMQARHVGEARYREARRILERGLAEFPFDQALWTQAGQFFAYLGPGVLSDPKEQEEWRLTGGRTLAHACELIGSNRDLPHQCVVAAGLLTKGGADAAARQFLERMKIVSDDPEILAFVEAQLRLVDAADHQTRHDAFRSACAADLPFASLGAMQVIGPVWNPATCASDWSACATSWRSWGDAKSRSDATNNVGEGPSSGP